MSGDPDTFERLRAALEQRKSVRGYKSQAIARDRLEALFAAAQRAPSWCNIQPWRIAVTAPPVTGQVSEALTQAAKSGMPAPEIPFPIEYPEPYRAHRRACGHALYGAMGITRDDKARRYDAWLRNYALFDAPHLAVVSRDRGLGEYATLDIGVWLGVLLTAAAVLGLDTCPMASVAAYPEPLRRMLDIPDDQVVLFGITIGHADPDVPANACRTERSPVADNVRFIGF
jgi:nitroreductase